MTEVSVRELKSKLAEYLRRVEAGEEIAVTRRGRRVAVLRQGKMVDRPKTLEEKLADMQARGILSWSGKKFKPSGRPAKLIGDGPSASEMIIEDRS